MSQTSSQLKTSARANLRGRWSTAVAMACLLALISAAGLWLTWIFVQAMQKNVFMTISAIAVAFIIDLLLLLFKAGSDYFFLKLGRKENCSMGDLVYAFRTRPDRILIAGAIFTGIGVLYSVPYIAAAYIFPVFTAPVTAFLAAWGIAGTILLAFFFLTFSQFIYVLLDDPDCGGLESLKKSARLMKGNRWRLLKILLSFIGWAFLELLSGGIGSLWIRPYFTETLTLFYRDLGTASEN